jgi:hypothetical protein
VCCSSLGKPLTGAGRRATGGDDVYCEGEEENEEWAFYVHGFTAENLLPLVQQALPKGWMAAPTPVPEDVYSGAQIAIMRR